MDLRFRDQPADKLSKRGTKWRMWACKLKDLAPGKNGWPPHSSSRLQTSCSSSNCWLIYSTSSSTKWQTPRCKLMSRCWSKWSNVGAVAQGGKDRRWGNLIIKIHKMTANDDPEAYLNAIARIANVDGWLKPHWTAIVIPCLGSPAQQAVDTLPVTHIANYKKVQGTILQTLNLSPKVYQRRIKEIEFGPDYHPCLTEQWIRVVCMRWLWLTECSNWS